MNRRGFLKSVLGAAVVATIPKEVLSAIESGEVDVYEHIYIDGECGNATIDFNNKTIEFGHVLDCKGHTLLELYKWMERAYIESGEDCPLLPEPSYSILNEESKLCINTQEV